MKTATRGNAAEARILAEFVCRGFNVLTPFGGGQPYDGRVPYDGLADLFAVHLPTTDAIYLIPVDAVPGHVGRMRLVPAKNNQRRGVRFAADFEIERWSEEKLRALSA